MSMQVIAFNSRIVVRPTMRTKIKRRIKEAVRLIVTRGAAVEESRGAKPRVVFRPEDVGAEKWIVPGMSSLHLLGDHTKSSADWTYIAIPTTEMFRMPFTEYLGLMRKALKYIHRGIPDVEKVLRSSGRQAPNSLEVVRLPLCSHSKFCRSTKIICRIRTGTQYALNYRDLRIRWFPEMWAIGRVEGLVIIAD
jgi:hypothetical protein